MSILRRQLFFLWLALLPFGYQLSAYTGFTEPDKLIAPALLLIGFFSSIQSPLWRLNRLIFFTVISAALIVIKNLSFLGSSELFEKLMWDDMVKIGYFVIPILCIDSIATFRKSAWIVVFIAIVGCMSAFMVSIGLIRLPVGIPEEFRLGIQWLPKAKGLFLSTGNLVQYVTFASAWAILAPGITQARQPRVRAARWILAAAVVMGLLGTQSRNLALALLVGLAVLWSIRKVEPLSGERRALFAIGITAVVIPIIGIILAFPSEVIDVLAGLGGESARNAATSRLHQYAVAWEVIGNHPLLGADPETYRNLGPTLDHIHNTWLLLLAHGGMVSAIIFFLLMARSFLGVRKLSHAAEMTKEAAVVTAYFASMLVSIMFYVGMDKMFWALFGIATAITCIEPLTKGSTTDGISHKIPQSVAATPKRVIPRAQSNRVRERKTAGTNFDP